MDITLNNPLKINNFDYLCGLRPPRLCHEKNMHIIAQQLNKVSTNKWRINIIFVNICRKKIISQMVRSFPASRYDRLICAEQHDFLKVLEWCSLKKIYWLFFKKMIFKAKRELFNSNKPWPEQFKLPLCKGSCSKVVISQGQCFTSSGTYLRKYLDKVTSLLKLLKKPFGSKIIKLPRSKRN